MDTNEISTAIENLQNKFVFTNDVNKTPLVSVTVDINEKECMQFLLNANFKTMGTKLTLIIAIVICVLFFSYIAVVAFLSKAYVSMVIYLIMAAIFGIIPLFIKYSAKKMSKRFPISCPYHIYSFYKHHFNMINDYTGITIGYDLLSRAVENSMVYLIFISNAEGYIIPKRNLSAENSEMIRAVLKNKLGDKFAVYSL